jgi:hypothetical protein
MSKVRFGEVYKNDEDNKIIPIEVTGEWPKMLQFHPVGDPADQQEMKLYEFKLQYRLANPLLPESKKAERISYRLYPNEIKMLAELGKVHGNKTAALRMAIKEAYERAFPS